MKPYLACPCFLVLLSHQIVGTAAEDGSGYLVQLQGDKLTLTPARLDQLPETAMGVFIWSEKGRDRSVVLSNDWQSKIEAERPAPTSASVAWVRVSRGEAGGSDTALSLAGGIQLPPADTTGNLRAVPFFTPLQEAQLIGNSPIVRRIPQDGKVPFPAAKATLTGPTNASKKEIVFEAGQDSLALSDLKPGSYSLNMEGLELVTFAILDPRRIANELAPIVEFEAAVGTDSPAALVYRIERLISDLNPNDFSREVANARDKSGYPKYLGDALDLAERGLKSKPTPYLRRIHFQLLAMAKRVAKIKVEAQPEVATVSTGIPQIDSARQAILTGRWNEAEKLLNAQMLSSPRAKALAIHYRAVLLAEGGPKRSPEAEGLFRESLELLEKSTPEDRLRGHANYASFLQREAQDTLNDSRFQTAAGVQAPLCHSLERMVRASEEYHTASRFASPHSKPGVRYNQARLMSLLADLIRSLDQPSPEVDAVLKAIALRIEELLVEATSDQSDDPLLKGQVFELRGQLALRNSDHATCRQSAVAAIEVYAAHGYFAGIEQGYRLLGQSLLAAKKPVEALKALQASHLISELLRDRLSLDRAGQTQAGFFSRRAFVLDTIVEILLEQQGHEAEALRYLEMAKARSLQDVLASRKTGPTVSRPVAAILQNWPEQTVALEYFLGRDRAWVLTVARHDGTTKVTAHPLPVKPGELLTNLQTFLREIEGYAPKMLNEFLATKKFNNDWERILFAFRQQLIPDSALEIVLRADSVVIVPQHLLHYFPFAILVTQLDPSANPESKKVAKPRFLVDERFVLSNAPSLRTWDLLRQLPAVPIAEGNAVGLVQARGQPPLPGVETDLKNLQEAFGTAKVNILRKEQATVSGARKLIQKPGGLLLLATHGFNEADQPLESFLMFHPDSTNDGKLRARSIFDHPIGPDLVILSACYTGLADRSPLPGDDLFGLQRAFLNGGARTVLGGYWDIYDGTAPELLGMALKLVAKKQGIGSALQQSQQAFLKKYRASDKAEPYLHPYFWGMYSLLGDERTGSR